MKKKPRVLSGGNNLLKIRAKLILLILLLSFSGINASTYAQRTTITLHVVNKPLKEVFKEVTEITEFKFLYSKEDINDERIVSISVDNQKIYKVLDDLFANTQVTYKIIGSQIVISKKKVSVNNKNISINQQKLMTITGTVTDREGETLPGVNIIVKGTINGTNSDFDGKYIIEAKEGATLEFSFIGMRTIIKKVGKLDIIDVVMSEDKNVLDEVVVVGYGTIAKKSLTASVAQIESEDIQTTTATSLAQKLSGKVAGLNIRQTGGEPGAYHNAINIRGFGAPIYVIDGITRGGSFDFQSLNAEDIESISVLKDASASVYGLNAANGVIIVTTKKGGKGKTKFTYNGTFSFSTPTEYPVMANAAQYMELRNDAEVNAGRAPFLSKEELDKWQAGVAGYESTDWRSETVLPYSFKQQHSLSATGGNEFVSYYLNVGYIHDNGILRSGDFNYKKYSFRSNISAKLSESLTANFNVYGVKDERNKPVQGSFQIWRGIASLLPISSVYANDDENYLNRLQEGQAMNPVAMSQSDIIGYAQDQVNLFQTSVDLSFKPKFAKGLEIKGVLGYDPAFNQSKSLQKDYLLYDYDEVNDDYTPTRFQYPSNLNYTYNNSYLVTTQLQANYKTTIAKDHNLSSLFVFETRLIEGRALGIRRYIDFYTNDQLGQTIDDNQVTYGGEIQSRSMSYIGRINYDYKGKYLVELVARYDGTYRYSPEVRWGLFPNISAGWRISEEEFMKSMSWLSNLKIRGSYGTIGEDTGTPFQYVPGYTAGGGYYSFEQGEITNAVMSPGIINPGLTWMTSTISDIGVDLGFFKGTFNITADIYQRYRTGILAVRVADVPNTFGGILPAENLNSDLTHGFDFTVSYNNSVGDFNYGASVNYNWSRSMTKHVEQAPFQSSWQRYVAGASNRYHDIIWSYNNTGQFQSEEEIIFAPIQGGMDGNSRELPGDFKYEDYNGDGVIDGSDIKPMSMSEVPRSFYGLNFNASWKGFDMNALFQGAAGFTVSYTHVYTSQFWNDANINSMYMDRWHRADPYDPDSELIPGEWPQVRFLLEDQSPMMAASAPSQVWRRSAAYLRFKNIEIGYTIKNQALLKGGVSSIRIYGNMSNVYTWADPFIKPFDPEAISGLHQAGWEYPLLRTTNLGVSFNF